MIYLQLFWVFIQVGLLSIGGGYAAIPIIQSQVVDKLGWLTMTEFIDLITIAEMTPGPLAINSATFVGTKIGGILGALTATAGFLIPSFCIVLLLAFLYFKFKNLTVVKKVLDGLRPAIVALIFSAGLAILILALWGTQGIEGGIQNVSILSAALFACSFIVLRAAKKVSPIFIMLGTGLVGVIVYFIGG